MSAVRDVLTGFGLVAIAYFAALNAIYLAFTVLAWRSLTHHLRRARYAAVEEAKASPLTPGVSILLPAYNEEAGIVESVRSLLDLDYSSHEVVAISDGSTDGTLDRLHREFDLVPVRVALRATIAHKPVRGIWISRRYPNLTVIDKENGGKADALNCGLCAAQHPYVCCVDADTMLEDSALLRVAKPILDDPQRVVATGGIVRIANGCGIESGRIVEVALPRRKLPTFQVVEYFRAFLVGRVAWSRMRALLIISGAFGLFDRAVVEEAGGYRTATVGEDAELVIRIHRHMRELRREYRIEFVPDPVCWTEAPESIRSLARQRRRWQRGLAECLWIHRRVIANPRYGALGLVAMPFFLIFELLGPLIAVAGFAILPVAAALGLVSLELLAAFAIVALVLGMLLSVAALALEELSFRRHVRHREAARLFAFAALDNFGFRQLIDLFRAAGLIDVLRGSGGWGEMERRGIGRPGGA